MLTRAHVSVPAAGLAAVLMLAAGQQAALAGGGPGGGNLVGSVTCGQSYSPQCDVTAGSGPSAGTPAGPGTQAGGQQAARTAAGGGGAGGCQGTVKKTFGCVPAGGQVTVQTLACPTGAAPPDPGGPGRTRPPDPGAAQPGDPLQPRSSAALPGLQVALAQVGAAERWEPRRRGDRDGCQWTCQWSSNNSVRCSPWLLSP